MAIISFTINNFEPIFFIEHHQIISQCNANLNAKKINWTRSIDIRCILNFHDAAKFASGRINGSLLSLTVRSCCPSRRRAKRKEWDAPRWATERSRWGNELQINSEHLHFCRHDESAREDRKSQAWRNATAWFSGFLFATSSQTRNSASYTCKSSKLVCEICFLKIVETIKNLYLIGWYFYNILVDICNK